MKPPPAEGQATHRSKRRHVRPSLLRYLSVSTMHHPTRNIALVRVDHRGNFSLNLESGKSRGAKQI